MSIFDQFLEALGTPSPAEAAALPPPDPYAGGDPAAGAAAIGHDFEETQAAERELSAAEKAKGRPLTQAETAALLARHPAADVSLATGPQAFAGFLRALAAFFGSLWFWVKVGGVVLLVVLLWALYGRVRGR